ncbi:mobilization protein [uncultured Eubacterium sp.]|uniref:plasmid mobilization protein n=1 Tax=uncultured Eubacterium sp. TaxID=165185 RepID=UPI00261F199E|nr:mobilization protein [uncultured Eubacterium sp.]
MTEKKTDKKGRFRNKIVAVRVSEAESEMINRMVSISGMSKQDYIINKLTNKDIVVEGSIRTFNGIKTQLAYINKELERIGKINEEHEEVFELLKIITEILLKIQENQNISEKKRMEIYKNRGGWSNV